MQIVSSKLLISYMIRSKWSILYDLMILADDVFCTNLSILNTAHVWHLIVFDASLSSSLRLMTYSFERWSITWERQDSSRWRHFHETAFIMIFLLSWTEFVISSSSLFEIRWSSLLMRVYSSNCIPKRFWISHTCMSVFRWMRILVWEARSNFSFSSLLWDTKMTEHVDMYDVSLNVISIFLLFNCSHTCMISYLFICIWSSEILIWSFNEIRLFRNRIFFEDEWLTAIRVVYDAIHQEMTWCH